MPDDNRHDPWADLIRGKQLPYLKAGGLTDVNARLLPVFAGPAAIAAAPKYGISHEDAASSDAATRDKIFARLVKIRDTYNYGNNALRIIGTGTQQENGHIASDYVNDLRAAGLQASEMGEPVVAAQFLKVAGMLERGENARTEAGKAYWVVGFKSALGWGEIDFSIAAEGMLSPLSAMDRPTVKDEAEEMSLYVHTMLQPGTTGSPTGLLQPEVLDGLIPYLEAETRHPVGYLDRVYSAEWTNFDWRNAPGNPMLRSVQAVRDYVQQVRNYEMPDKYRDLERWKAEIQGDLEETANTAFVKIENENAWKLWRGFTTVKDDAGNQQVVPQSLLNRVKAPTKNVPIDALRHMLQSQRRWTKPVEATTNAPLSYLGAISKVIAAADSQTISMDERSRLLKEALRNLQDPWTTIIKGDRPAQTWGDTFGKKGESIAMAGEWFEKAGKKLQESSLPDHKLEGYAAERWGKLLRENAQQIAPWAETAAFMAPGIVLEGPGASTAIGKALGGVPGLRAANTAAQLYPILGSTPETAYPMLAISAARGMPMSLSKKIPFVGGATIPHLDPHTGRLGLPNFLGDNAPMRAVNTVLEHAHPIPSTSLDFWGMHELSKAQYEPPVEDPPPPQPGR